MLAGIFFRKKFNHLSDDDLLLLIRANNLEAMNEIFVRYSLLVKGVCLKYLKNEAEAEDVMMELFSKLSNKVQNHTISNFRSWLYSVSKNECLMLLRKNKINLADSEKELMKLTEDSTESLQLAQLNEQKILLLSQAMEGLNEEQKQCVELFYLNNKSYDEIASSTGYEVKKVKSYIQNGKRNLKLKLEHLNEFKTT
ncbi:MAG: sigma-70 family RNA polymerase sigma factor [Crocinitomicaceae bacterium]|nr:sigma-70 family RNA polymerase sigma factor [Crocinitomicaceae bacterium]MBK8925957.1 sigma-70 family RNA polymerase sigma factor [Crocinitomicaceae bacterium]